LSSTGGAIIDIFKSASCVFIGARVGEIMPKLDGILETAIHTEDIVRSRAFYEGVLGLEPIYSDNRLSAYAVVGRDVLLIFRKGTTGQTVTLPSGTIPGLEDAFPLRDSQSLGPMLRRQCRRETLPCPCGR
jgi:catechol-2,3-dioxygenase